MTRASILSADSNFRDSEVKKEKNLFIYNSKVPIFDISKSKLDWRSTMSSPRTGILSLIRFDLGQNWDVLD